MEPYRVIVDLLSTSEGARDYVEGVALAKNSFGDVFVLLTPKDVPAPGPITGGWYRNFQVAKLT